MDLNDRMVIDHRFLVLRPLDSAINNARPSLESLEIKRSLHRRTGKMSHRTTLRPRHNPILGNGRPCSDFHFASVWTWGMAAHLPSFLFVANPSRPRLAASNQAREPKNGQSPPRTRQGQSRFMVRQKLSLYPVRLALCRTMRQDFIF